MEILFNSMIQEVDNLLDHPNWFPIERCQLSFYSKKLKFFFTAFESLTITNQDHISELLTDPTLHILVSTILEYKNARTSVELLKFNHFPVLTGLGDRLATEVGMIYKASQDSGNAEEEWHSQDFPSHFCFNQGGVFVGFQEEASNLLQQLACITKKHLEVICIVGMGGLGKTTLARKLYIDPYVVSYFYVRTWVTFSQLYKKRDLLLSILKSVIEITDEIFEMDDNALAHDLYRALKGRRYLIVIDDIWSITAWDDFKRCFPDDNNGSRILLTTRLKDVAVHAQSDRNPLCLRFLTDKESFDLFRQTTCLTESFFDYFSVTGKSIAKKCQGLPLAIVVIAGLLKNNIEMD